MKKEMCFYITKEFQENPPQPIDDHQSRHTVVQHDHPAPPPGGYSADIDALARHEH